MSPVDALKNFARRHSLKGKEKDPSLTGIEPFSEIKTVSVFFDADIPGAPQTIARIQDYFKQRGKTVFIYAISLGAQIFSEGMQKATFIHREDINWFGKIKTRRRRPGIDAGEDLFISLFAENNFPVEYAARCSKARFKAGRFQIPGYTYDLVIRDPQGSHLSQNQAFDAIMDFIGKIEY